MKSATNSRHTLTRERVPVGSVLLALEAKACMTAHIKALPRLHDELNSSHAAIHGASDSAIAAGFAMVNLSDHFLSSDKNKFDLPTIRDRHGTHISPRMPFARWRRSGRFRVGRGRARIGFDALGIVVVSCRNDGSRVELIDTPPAPSPNDIFHYDSMIRRIAHLYESKFDSI